MRELTLGNCGRLERVRISKLPALRTLDLSNSAVRLLELAELPALELLDLRGCRRLATRGRGPLLNRLQESVPQGCQIRV